MITLDDVQNEARETGRGFVERGLYRAGRVEILMNRAHQKFGGIISLPLLEEQGQHFPRDTGCFLLIGEEIAGYGLGEVEAIEMALQRGIDPSTCLAVSAEYFPSINN